MSLSISDIRRTISPLRLVFWGGLICVLDITFSEVRNGEGWKFDILNDFVGMLMITWGVYQLAEIAVHDRYRTAMSFVKLVAVLSCVDAFHGHFIYQTPPLVVFLFLILGIAAMVATVVFSVAMRWLSTEAGLLDSARSWRTTTLLFVVIYLIPLGLFYCAAAVAFVTGESFHINLGPAGLFLVPVFFIPLIHLFISTSRMGSEADSIAHAGYPDLPPGNYAGDHPDDFPFCQ